MLHFILDGNVSYQWVVSVLCPIKTLLDFITFYCDNGGTNWRPHYRFFIL